MPCITQGSTPGVKRLRRPHNRESIFASLGQSVYRGSSQELRSRELVGRNGRNVKRKWLGVPPICTFRGLAVRTTSVRKQKNPPGLERSLQVCRKLRRKPLTQRPKFIPHFWHSRRSSARGQAPVGQAVCRAGRDARGRFAAPPPPVLRGRKADLAAAHAEAAALAPWKAALKR